MTGLRVSLPITLILVVISEMVGSTDGIGYFILDSQRRFKVAQMYAGMFSLATARLHAESAFQSSVSTCCSPGTGG